jgi:signal transduction histidine kinase
MAFLYPLLLLQSIPSFLAQRQPHTALAPVSLTLAAVPCVLVVLALAGRGAPSRRMLLLAASVYLPVAALEALETRSVLPDAYLPWLLVVAPVFIPSLALGTRSIRGWMIGNVAGIAIAAVVYAPRMPAGRLAMTVFSLAVFSASASAGIRALRRRADRADAARRAASRRFNATQRRIAIEEERARTDALIHDSLLNALLVAPAASQAGPAARRDALRCVKDAVMLLRGSFAMPEQTGRLEGTTSTADALERELRPLSGSVELSVLDVFDVQLAPRVRDAFISATLQAVNNSIKHADTATHRAVRLESDADGSVRIVISDDGAGFDLSSIGTERLGVRISIVKRMESVGGSAAISTAPGSGTRVTLIWPSTPEPSEPAVTLALSTVRS